MKKNVALIAGFLLVSPFPAVAQDTASWANWITPTTGSFIQGSKTIDVTYSGNTFETNYGSFYYNVPSSFTSAEVSNTPGTNGTLLMTGGTDQVNNFHFSQPVVDPIMVIFSVGNPVQSVTLNFLNAAEFSILSEGAGNWGPGRLKQNGTSITGVEGNGLLRFHGTYTDISFTTPDYEYYYGGTIGAIAAIPEPASYAMLLAGMVLIMLLGRSVGNVSRNRCVG